MLLFLLYQRLRIAGPGGEFRWRGGWEGSLIFWEPLSPVLIDFTGEKGKRSKGNYESKGRVPTSELFCLFVLFCCYFSLEGNKAVLFGNNINVHLSVMSTISVCCPASLYSVIFPPFSALFLLIEFIPSWCVFICHCFYCWLFPLECQVLESGYFACWILCYILKVRIILKT